MKIENRKSRRKIVAASENKEAGANCRFFFINPEGPTICRRFPPQNIGVDGGARFNSLFPIMQAIGWCGEWQKK